MSVNGFTRKTDTVELFGGDYEQRIAEARDAAMKAADDASKQKTPKTRLAADLPDDERLAKAHDDLVAEARTEGSVVVSLRALNRVQWRDLVAAHPPRKDNEGDETFGINEESFSDALVPLSITGVKPEVVVADLLEELSSAQFDVLYGMAFRLNRRVDVSPKERLSSGSLSSGATSN